MKNFQIIRYLKKAQYFIFVFALLGSIIVYNYATSHQVYTASVAIEYSSDSAKEGKTPNGEEIDTSKIYSSRVITDAIKDLGTGRTMESIRSSIYVNEIIPSEEATKKKNALEKGNSYEFTPTKYLISYNIGDDGNGIVARDTLDAVIQNYLAYYSEEYVDTELLPNEADDKDSNYDYIERTELMEENVFSIIQYLNVKAKDFPDFRSSATGYSFSDLLNIYNDIYNNNIPNVYAEIINGKYSTNTDILLKKYSNRVNDNNVSINTLNTKKAELEKLMAQYSNKTDDSIKYNYGKDAQAYILKDVVGNEKVEHKNTTYDDLIAQYVDVNKELKNLSIDNDYANYIIAVFNNTNKEKITSVNEKTDKNITKLTEKLNEYHKTLLNTVKEYNKYQGAQNISVLSSINVAEKINVKLYLLLAIITFLFVGCILSIVIGRVIDFVEYVLYVDSKTNLPNRAYCDVKIDKLSKKALDGDFTVVAIYLEKLETISNKGRTHGDNVLRSFGEILKNSCDDFGFVGRNSVNFFICLLKDGDVVRINNFIDEFKKNISMYNEENEDEKISYSYGIANAEEENCYEIRKLIRKAIEKHSQAENK